MSHGPIFSRTGRTLIFVAVTIVLLGPLSSNSLSPVSAAAVAEKESASARRYQLEHLTFGGFQGITQWSGQIAAVAERSVCILTEDAPLTVDEWYDLQPALGGEILIGATASGDEGRLYLATSAGFLGVEMIEDKIQPFCHYVWPSKTINEVVRGLHYADETLYLYAGDTGLFVFDCSQPTQPELAMVYRNATSSIQDLVSIDRTLYCADGVAGLRVMDIAERGVVQERTVLELDHWPLGIALVEDRALLPTWTGELIEVAISGDATKTPTESAKYRLDARIHRLVHTDGYYYGATERGLWTAPTDRNGGVDIGQQRIVRVGETVSHIFDLLVHDGRLVLLDEHGIIITSAIDTDHSEVLSVEQHLPACHSAYHDLWFHGGEGATDPRLHIAMPTRGIGSYALNRGALEAPLSMDAPQSFIRAHATNEGDGKEDTIWVGAYGNIHRVSVGPCPVVEASYPIGDITAFRIQSSGPNIYFSTDRAALFVLDTRTGTVSSVLTLDHATRILDFVRTDRHIVCATERGVHIFSYDADGSGAVDPDTAPPPQLVYSRGREWCQSVAVDGGLVAVAAGSIGCYLLELGPEVTHLRTVATPSAVDAVSFGTQQKALYLGCEDRLLVLSRENYTIERAYPLGAPAQSVLEYGDELFIGTSKAGLYHVHPVPDKGVRSTLAQRTRFTIGTAIIGGAAATTALVWLFPPRFSGAHHARKTPQDHARARPRLHQQPRHRPRAHVRGRRKEP